jgi:hypothetical protein
MAGKALRLRGCGLVASGREKTAVPARDGRIPSTRYDWRVRSCDLFPSRSRLRPPLILAIRAYSPADGHRVWIAIDGGLCRLGGERLPAPPIEIVKTAARRWISRLREPRASTQGRR